MITLEKFEQLVEANIVQKPVALAQIGAKGELLDEWVLSISNISKHQQYIQTKVLLSELLVAEMDDNLRLDIMVKLTPFVERIVGQLRVDYIYEHQVLSEDRQTSINEVRSLYFLMILVYKNVANRAFKQLEKTFANDKPTSGWLSGLLGNITGSSNPHKATLVWAVYNMVSAYLNVLLEYALTYQRAPKVVWQQLNLWYLRATEGGVATTSMDKLIKKAPADTICAQYRQACLTSFANFFAYRRQDIVNGFKVLPDWVKYVDITFEARPELKIFVNLHGNHPPEVITPYATVNPYSSEYRCLFIDITRLLAYLKEVQQGVFITSDVQTVFESRLAKMILIAIERRAEQDRTSRLGQQADFVVGVPSIFKEVSGGENLSSVIRQRALAPEYHAKPTIENIRPKETVRVFSKNDNLARFIYKKPNSGDLLLDDVENVQDEVLMSSFLPVFGLFALKSHSSEHKNPWRLGVAHWVDRVAEGIEVDGRFLGRILVAGGVRLHRNDTRSLEFFHAFLIDGDELNQQSTLVVPRSHFKAGDFVLLRVDTKEIELRLERSLLTTEEIEQYEIVRLNG
ncbi:hypothetical protein [Moraxella oblonga]|uniref:hypothetical protein n=1 Tax=Moraxella oblonga TaxID=200413 RepID=UPI00082CE206|nr:hypothetical protein [Moraxella oblonga]